MSESFPENLRQQIDQIEQEVFDPDEYDTLDEQFVIEAYNSQEAIAIELLDEFEIEYEDGEGVYTLYPVAPTPFGVLCEKMDADDDMQHVIVTGSVFSPGIDNSVRDSLDLTDVMESIVFNKKDQDEIYIDVIQGERKRLIIYSKMLSTDRYLSVVPVHIGDDVVALHDVNPELGHIDPLLFATFVAQKYYAPEPIIVFMPLIVQLSKSRLKRMIITDYQGNERVFPNN